MVDPSDHDRVVELFEAALATSAGERHDFLRGECAGDERLQSRVLALLQANDHPHRVLQTLDATVSLGADLASAAGEMHIAGEILGDRYRIDRFLGRGGMGEVWLAFDLKLRINVALKSVLKDRFPRRDALELIRREVLSARAVVSPNVCRIFDLQEIDDHEYVAMEYIDGATLLETLVARGPLDLREAASIASQLLAGLESIHEAGLVHGDIKPENIMITRSGRVVVMDFGLAKPGSKVGAIAGTPAYMAPEQAQGEALDARTDIFAAGVVLAEMVTPGGLRSAESRRSTQRGVRKEPPELPETPWRPVLARAVAKDREVRFASAHELVRALEEITLRAERAEGRIPYPGLAAFTDADAEFFFGREIEVESLWKKLQESYLLAVVGPSGTGKSSFVRAGLVPAMPEGWARVVCQPGMTPIGNLIQVLARETGEQARAVGEAPTPEDLAWVVGMATRWRRRHDETLLIVDQFEELFTLSPPDAQATFSELLGRLTLEADFHVLLSMRDDFLHHCHAHPTLAPILSDLTLLGPLAGTGLRRALVQPALLCGYRFEDDALVDEMLEGIAAERGALPLLAFAVARLWEERDRDRGLLTYAAYERVGGAGGALARHAEATLERIGTDREPLVREIFRNLVTAQGTRSTEAIEELLSVFDDRTAARQVLQSLIEARLLTSYEMGSAEQETSSGGTYVEVIHESLLTAWPRLVRWRTQDAGSAQFRDQLRQAARLWEERGRPTELLWSGASYLEYQAWRAKYPGGLTEREDAFARAMVANAERRQRRRRLVTAGAFLTLAVVLAVVGGFWLRAERETQRAEAQNLLNLGRIELEGDPTKSLAYAIASLERHDTDAVRRHAVEALWKGPTYFVPLATWTGPPVGSVDFSGDGQWLACRLQSGDVLVYAEDGSPPRSFTVPGVGQIRFTSPSELLVQSESPGKHTIHLLSIPDGSPKFDVTSSAQFFAPLSLSADATSVLTDSITWDPLRPQEAHHTLQSWPMSGGEPIRLGELRGVLPAATQGNELCSPIVDPTRELLAYVKAGDILVSPLQQLGTQRARMVGKHPVRAFLVSLSFSPDGRRLASFDDDGNICLWNVNAEADSPVRCLDAQEETVWKVRFDPSGSVLGSAQSGSARLWTLVGPGSDAILLRGHEANVVDLAFGSDGRWVATVGLGIREHGFGLALWPIGRDYSRVLRGHTGQVFDLAFLPDGRSIVSCSWDQTARIWSFDLSSEVSTSTEIDRDPTAFANCLAVDHEGRRVLTGGGGVRLISLEDESSQLLPGIRGNVWGVAFSPDGRLAAGGATDDESGREVVQIWNLETGESRVFDPGEGEFGFLDFIFTGDGHLLSSGWGGLLRWNLEDGSHEKLLPKNYTQMDLDPSGRHLALIDWSSPVPQSQFGSLIIYDLETGETRAQPHGLEVADVKFGPTGEMIVTGDCAGTVRAGRIDAEPHLLLGHEKWVRAVAVSPDGQWIASASEDATIRVWPMPEGTPLHVRDHADLLARLCTHTNLRVVEDAESESGYRVEPIDFAGWETGPSW